MTKNSGTALTGGSSPSVSVAMTTAGSVGAIQDANVQLLKAGAPVGSNKAVGQHLGHHVEHDHLRQRGRISGACRPAR